MEYSSIISEARALAQMNPELLLKELQAPLPCRGPHKTCGLTNCEKLAIRALAADSKKREKHADKQKLFDIKAKLCKTLKENKCPEFMNVCK
jgi:hypothetical protein